jgi:hypothetical protein
MRAISVRDTTARTGTGIDAMERRSAQAKKRRNGLSVIAGEGIASAPEFGFIPHLVSRFPATHPGGIPFRPMSLQASFCIFASL